MDQPQPQQDPLNKLMGAFQSNRHRRDFDCVTFLLWISTITCVISGGAALLGMNDAEDWRQHHKLRSFYVTSTIFLVFASVFNEAFLDRCWRRVTLQALRGPSCAASFRAANFSLRSTVQRALTLSLSRRELAVGFAYLFLRGGTLAAIPLSQLTATLEIKNFDYDGQSRADIEVHKHGYMIALAVLAHIIAVALGLGCVKLRPWALFRYKFNNEEFQAAFQPYLTQIQGGSIASAKEVAKVLEHPDDLDVRAKLEKHHQPGWQVMRKIKFMLPGVTLMCVSMGLVTWYHLSTLKNKPGHETYIFALGCLAANLGFTMTLEQTVWNMSLECMTGPGLSLTWFLGTTSGIMLTGRCIRTPTRAKLFVQQWIFAVQSAVVRILFVTTIGMKNMQRADSPYEVILDPLLLWQWLLILAIALPFVGFLIGYFKIPVCAYDRWRLAKVLEGISACSKVKYRAKYGYVCCAEDAKEFSRGVLK